MLTSDGGAKRPLSALLILLWCALAGAAGLSYEVAWTHALALAAGNSQRALAVVLAGFLGGMALGGFLAGHPRLRDRSPLRLCGFLECLLGLCGLLYPWLLARLPQLSVGLVGLGAPSSVARLLVVGLVLAPPTILMGMTFPLWVRGLLQREPQSVGRATALVSAFQVAGAAGGAFIAGFVLVPDHGYAAASIIAGVIDLVIGGGLILFGVGGNLGADRSKRSELIDAPRVPERRLSNSVLGAAFLGCGFASIGYQVVWTRALVFYFDGFHYAFSAVLVSFLVGLGLGAGCVAFFAPRVAAPERWLAGTQIMCGLMGLASWFFVPWIGEPAAAIRALDDYPIRVFGLAALVLVVPAAALGTTLPLATWAATRVSRRLSTGLSRAYAQVTIGNALAAAVVPLALVPLFGLRAAWLTLVIVNGIAAVLLARHGGARLLGGALALVAITFGALETQAPRPLILSSHVFTSGLGRDRALVEWDDGESCSVAVVRDLNHGATTLYTDTFAAAATGREYPYMRLLGHLPALLADDPDRALVICFGTGTTAGAVSLHDGVSELRIVDVESRVFEAAGHFREVNHGVLDGRPGLAVEPVVEDGRFDLLCATRPYDVITLEPLMPYTSGAVPFYTREFYELARDRLTPDGVLCQWIPIHAIPIHDYKSLVRTFVDVFPGAHLYFFEQSSLLIARSGEKGIPFEVVRSRASEPAVAADLEAALVGTAADLVAARVAGGEVLERLTRDAEIVRDDRPFVAFRTVRPEADPRRPLRDTLQFLVDCAEAEAEAEAPGPVTVPKGDLAEVRSLSRVRRGLLSARLEEAETWLRGAVSGEAVSFRPALDAYGQAIARSPEHLEGRTLIRRLSFFLERQQVASLLLSGEPLRAFHALDLYRGAPEWTLGEDATQALALLAAGDAVGAAALAARVTDAHPRHALGVAVLEKAAALSDDTEGMRRARELEGEPEANRLRERRAYVARVQAACRTEFGAPLIAFRKALAKVVATDVLADPDVLERAVDVLRLRSGSPFVPLLAASVLRELDAADPGVETVRAIALLGVGRARDRVGALARSVTDPEMRSALSRCEAALVPRSAERVRELLASEDVVVRRFVTAMAAGRAGRDHVPVLIDALADRDPQVRLYADRALRTLTGKNAGFDYLAAPEIRSDAIDAWRRLVE